MIVPTPSSVSMSRDGAFDLVRPTRGERHIVVEIPHAGLAIPDDVRPQLRVEPAEVLRDADLYVDRLWAGAASEGASTLVARVSRYVVDLNRAEDDVDRDVVPDHPAPRPTQNRGVVWRTTTDGLPALVAGRLSYAALEARLARYHRPYHAALADEVERKVATFGRALLVAAHSMPSANRPGGPRRADVVPGSRGGTTTDRRVLDVIESHFHGAGLSVRHDDPYRGGFTTQRYGRQRDNVHAVQIELNRALYVDERTSEPDEPQIAWLTKLMTELVRKLAAIEL
ncbi:MAG: N-formylglutamate amidohydrolase [Sandaracinaceae bacterium]